MQEDKKLKRFLVLQQEFGIQLVRYYPVYKGETEEQAYLQKLE